MSKPQEPEETGDEQVRPEPAAIPEGYGVDRVGAMAVDPERLFVYWELTDGAIERARKRADDEQAPVVLRVYETTGRIFDGTNAHSHFDHKIDRADRRWFFDIDKPGSEVVVELGLQLDGDRFAKIARSRRVEFPRAEASAPSTPRWLTVRVREGRPDPTPDPVRPTPEPVRPSPGSRHEWPQPPQPSTAEAGPAQAAPAPVQQAAPQQFVTEPAVPVELHSEQRSVVQREQPADWNSWETGPLTTRLKTPAPWTENYSGETRFYRDGPQTRVVTGPWEVVIRGLGAYRHREVLARWEIHRSWVTETGSETHHELPGNAARLLGSSELAGLGASERLWLVGSELRLTGSSELLYRGASERRLGGASERLFRGASERRLGGASERLLRGASERRLGGASERRFRGASERLHHGASERRLGITQARRQAEGARAYPNVKGDLDDE